MRIERSAHFGTVTNWPVTIRTRRSSIVPEEKSTEILNVTPTYFATHPSHAASITARRDATSAELSFHHSRSDGWHRLPVRSVLPAWTRSSTRCKLSPIQLTRLHGPFTCNRLYKSLYVKSLFTCAARTKTAAYTKSSVQTARSPPAAPRRTSCGSRPILSVPPAGRCWSRR